MTKQLEQRLLQLAISGLLILSATACSSRKFSITAPTPPQITANDYSEKAYSDDMKIYGGKMPSGSAATLEEVQKARDNIVYGLMTQIDGVFGEYNLRLYSGKGAESVVFDSLTLGLTSASTIATHAPTKTLLSALGTAITGLNLSVDKNIFAQQTFQVLAIAMQTRRDKIRTAIVQCNLPNDVDHYPLAAAKRDLIAYYYAGTLPGGLQELQEESGVATANAASGNTGSATNNAANTSTSCATPPATAPPATAPPATAPPATAPPATAPPATAPPATAPSQPKGRKDASVQVRTLTPH